jgi:hypothetical protein
MALFNDATSLTTQSSYTLPGISIHHLEFNTTHSANSILFPFISSIGFRVSLFHSLSTTSPPLYNVSRFVSIT